ncbi:MAG: orotate phosphoribosyltransferase [Gemmatimonadaceae bacterium]|nr:orotate phosphoribosyltransferase [Gemmatimonadaceae bacterium]
MPSHDQLAALLARLSYREGDFTLTSGATSNFYLDAKQVTYHPDGVALVGAAMHAIAREFGAAAIGGPTMGADAIVLCAVYASGGSDRPLTGFVVRKEPKKHGLGKWIEGINPAGQKVAIVDDVITSGGSLLKAAAHVQEAGAEIVVAIGLVDREQGGREAIEAAGFAFRAVCTLSDVRAQFRGAR